MATVAAVQPGSASSTAESYSHVERKGFAVYMIVGPLILLGATIIHPAHGVRATSGVSYYTAAYDHTTRFYIAHTLFFFTAVTLSVAVVGLTRLIRPTNPKRAFWGLVFSVMGFVGWGAIDGIDFMTYIAGSEKSLNTNTMQAYINDVVADNPVLIPVTAIFTLLIIALVWIALALHSAGIAPLWLGLLLPIGVTGVISFLNYPPLEIASGLCVCAAVIPVGIRQLRAQDVTVPEQGAATVS
jgi:hypothetical protein